MSSDYIRFIHMRTETIILRGTGLMVMNVTNLKLFKMNFLSRSMEGGPVISITLIF
jgi:hypothetical protein